MSSWYEKYMPKIEDIKPYISETLDELKKITGVKSTYIWGSYAKNINNPSFRVRDIDVLTKTAFHSGDLISINNDVINNTFTDDYLENQGYDPFSVKFSEKFLKLKKYNIDCWAISKDRKLLHWGALPFNENDSKKISEEAENYAKKITGVNRKKMNVLSKKKRKNWYNSYCHYFDKCFENMPTGWYKTKDIKIKDILSKTIKI